LPDTDPRYHIEVNSRQARLLATALDFWDRVHGGQFDELRDCAHRDVSREMVRDHCDAFKRDMRPDLGPGAADFSFPGGRLAFNMRKALEFAYMHHEQPPTSDTRYLTWYQGPLAGWWEGEPEMLVTPLQSRQTGGSWCLHPDSNTEHYLTDVAEQATGKSLCQLAVSSGWLENEPGDRRCRVCTKRAPSGTPTG
jgi:hypothetical protein